MMTKISGGGSEDWASWGPDGWRKDGWYRCEEDGYWYYDKDHGLSNLDDEHVTEPEPPGLKLTAEQLAEHQKEVSRSEKLADATQLEIDQLLEA